MHQPLRGRVRHLLAVKLVLQISDRRLKHLDLGLRSESPLLLGSRQPLLLLDLGFQFLNLVFCERVCKAGIADISVT